MYMCSRVLCISYIVLRLLLKESDAVISEVLLFCYCVTLHIWS
jgi:hypothetical protein